jgi:putative membrane protein
MMTGFGMGFGGFGFIFMALFWIVIIGVGIWLLSNLFPKNNASSQSKEVGGESAVEILRRRYALGELTKEEYESMRYEVEH